MTNDKEKMFRVVKHVAAYAPNEVVKYFDKYLDAVKLAKKSKKYWIEGKINGEWYGLA